MNSGAQLYRPILATSAFLVMGAWSLWAFPWHLSSSDAAFYLLNAEELAGGQFKESVSAYWSPLWSWLMVPFFWLGFSGLWPMKLLQLLLGALGIWSITSFLETLTLRSGIRVALYFLLAMALWMMHLSHTPDMLMALLLFWYFKELYCSLNTDLKVWKIGLIGASLYWCKSFGFPFFLTHFMVWMVWQYWKERESLSQLIRSGIRILGVFLFFSLMWIGILTLKFGFVGLGTSGSYNLAYMGPEMNFQPPYFDSFVDPESDYTRYFIAEEQGFFAKHGKWSPLNSREEFQYYLSLLQNNLSKIYYVSFIRDALIILAFIGIILGLKGRESTILNRSFFAQAALFLAIYLGAYFMIFPNERYLWIAYLLLPILIWMGISGIKQMRLIGIWQIGCLVVIFLINILSFAETRLEGNQFYSSFHEAAPSLESLKLEGKAIISNRRSYHRKLKDHMDVMSLICYQDKSKVWGLMNTKTLESQHLQAIEDLPLDYFFLWGEVPNADYLFKDKKKILEIPEIDLTVYRLTLKDLD